MARIGREFPPNERCFPVLAFPVQINLLWRPEKAHPMPGIGWAYCGGMARNFSPRQMARSTMKNVRRLQCDSVLDWQDSSVIGAVADAVSICPAFPSPGETIEVALTHISTVFSHAALRLQIQTPAEYGLHRFPHPAQAPPLLQGRDSPQSQPGRRSLSGYASLVAEGRHLRV